MSYRLLVALIGLAAVSAQEIPHKNELAFQLGGFPALSRGKAQNGIDLGPGLALQLNFARRIVDARWSALYGEVHFLASPLREVSSTSASATRDAASLYVTPGVRWKFFPVSTVSPYLAAGGGVAWYEQSTAQLDGQPNTAPRELLRGAFDFGGGADVRVRHYLALRGEVRDFYTGSPAYNVASIRGGQHNVVLSGAFVLRWH